MWGWLNSCSPAHSRDDSAGVALEGLALRTNSVSNCTGVTPQVRPGKDPLHTLG